MSNPFRVIACAERGGELILSNELNMTNISQELIAYLGDAWILQWWGEILCKIVEVTQNLWGSTEIPELTLPENSVFLGSGLDALVSITHRAKALIPVPTVIKYEHMRILVCCVHLALMHKKLSTRHKHEVISYNVFLHVVSYNDFLVTFFPLWQIKEWENMMADTKMIYCLYSSPWMYSRNCKLNRKL